MNICIPIPIKADLCSIMFVLSGGRDMSGRR